MNVPKLIFIRTYLVFVCLHSYIQTNVNSYLHSSCLCLHLCNMTYTYVTWTLHGDVWEILRNTHDMCVWHVHRHVLDKNGFVIGVFVLH